MLPCHCTFFTLVFVLFTAACEQERVEVAVAAPWRAGSRLQDEKTEARPFSFAAAAHQRLQISLSSKKGQTVEGSWGIAPSQLRLRLDDLSHCSLRIQFPFSLLRVSKLHPRAQEMRIQRTQEAMNWLQVKPSEVAHQNGQPIKIATRVQTDQSSALTPELRIEALRNLDTRRAYQGSIEKKLPETLAQQFPQFAHQQDAERLQFRSVRAKAAIRIRLNRIETQAQLPVRLYFVYSGGVSKQSTPLAVIIKGDRPLGVSLREHELQPRGADGRVLAKQKATLAAEIGTIAQIEGALLFQSVVD